VFIILHVGQHTCTLIFFITWLAFNVFLNFFAYYNFISVRAYRKRFCFISDKIVWFDWNLLYLSSLSLGQLIRPDRAFLPPRPALGLPLSLLSNLATWLEFAYLYILAHFNFSFKWLSVKWHQAIVKQYPKIHHIFEHCETGSCAVATCPANCAGQPAALWWLCYTWTTSWAVQLQRNAWSFLGLQ